MHTSLVAGTLVMALVIAGCAGGGAGVASTPPAPSAAAATSPSAAPSSTPASASTAELAYAGDDAEFPAGTYATSHFRFPFTAELDTLLEVRDAGDTDRLVFIGQDKNAPENADEELTAMLLERVVDPVDQRSIGPLDGDLLRWFEDHPRLTAEEGARKDVEVDGEPAVQLDLLPSDMGPCGSFHPDLQCVLVGYGPEGDEPFAVFGGSRLRIVVTEHLGTPVLFTYQATDDDRFESRASVFDHWVGSVDFR
jgi:hypothetical protein